MFLLVIILLITFLIFIKFFKKDADNVPSIPGLKPVTPELGNLAELGKAGSLHQFLLKLHQEYGDIAGFWLGPQYVVSICSPELFKQHQGVFDRPSSLFKLLEPIIGRNSLQYANKEDAKFRRKNYDRVMSHKYIKMYIPEFKQCSLEILKKFEDKSKMSHPLCMYTKEFALKVGLLTTFGNIKDESKITDFHKNHQIYWNEMESRLSDKDIPPANSPREIMLQKAIENNKLFVRGAVEERKNIEISEDYERLIDIMVDISADEDTLISDAITYVVGSFHTTANSLSWCFYFLAKHQDVQEKLIIEIMQNIGASDDLDFEDLSKLPYLKQVFEETIRCSVLAPYAGRYLDDESVLGGYIVPAGTPVIHALGVSLLNPKYWPNPSKFDPDRFSPENVKNRPTLAYQPFGFAGKRICPGYRFATIEAYVFVVMMLRKFKFRLVENQDIKQVYGLVTHPSDEIWVKVELR